VIRSEYNACTDKYDRDWNSGAWNGPFRFWLTVVTIPGALGIVWFLARNRVVRRVAVGLMFVSGLGMAMFSLNYYMPTISSTWSQKGLWDAYYNLCTRTEGPPNADPKKRFCEEAVFSYKLNWRGETYYTQNEVIPILDERHWEHLVDTELAEERRPIDPFYGIMQRGRYKGAFKQALPGHLRGKSCKVYNRNIKFVLIRLPCDEEIRQRARELGYLEDPRKKGVGE